MTATLYGIRSCDTVRKARKWLAQQGIAHHFHDLREDGLDSDLLAGWVSALGWETLLNRRSTSWRQLDDSDRQNLDGDRALALMLDHPTLIKRPVLMVGGRVTVGFTPEGYRQALSGPDN